MKLFKTTILTLLIVLGTSCSLSLQDDPNAIKPDQLLPSQALNGLQINLAGLFQNASTVGMQLTRSQNSGGSTYDRSITPQTFDGLWNNAYANILIEAKALAELSDDNGFARHAGIARIISAYTILLLVDYFGEVPYSESFQGAENFNPALDDPAELYQEAIDLLNQAKLDLTTNLTTDLAAPGYLNPLAPAITDMYYGNTITAGSPTKYAKWVRLANTLKLKAYLNTGNVTEMNNIITNALTTPTANNGLIETADQNFIFRYSTNLAAPDSRHPRFIANYPGGGGNYMSNWLMWHMVYGYDQTSSVGASVGTGDPRIRFYFYRQTTSNNTDPNNIRCLTEAVPDHYPRSTGAAIISNARAGIPPLGNQGTQPSVDPSDPAWSRTFCYPSDKGYWGRDHVDPQGIPPDGLLRTAWGVYPAGGRFDNNAGASMATGAGGTGNTFGQRGAGFQPIMMRSFVQFMLAEAILVHSVTAPLAAVTYFQNGINFSMTDVRNWAVNGTLGTSNIGAVSGEGATIDAFYPPANYTTDVATYVAAATASFNVSAAEALNYNSREFWIASFGNGIEAYNMYRRTGRPTGMQPVINPEPTPFPRVVWYPQTAATLNSNITQRTTLSGKVFWNQNATENLDF